MLGHLLPELKSNQYKGNSGKLVIIGGSLEYTGAPYFAGISALRSGCDLCKIACPVEAAIPIKCYSPDLIVQPISKPDKEFFIYSSNFVIGPGMGRSDQAE